MENKEINKRIKEIENDVFILQTENLYLDRRVEKLEEPQSSKKEIKTKEYGSICTRCKRLIPLGNIFYYEYMQCKNCRNIELLNSTKSKEVKNG